MKAMIGALAMVMVGLVGASALADEAKDTRYTLTVEAPAPKVGQPGAVRLVIKPQAGWHWNAEYPAKLSLAAPDAVTVVNPELKQADGDFKVDAGNTVATFTVTAKKAGAIDARISGKFGVCDDRSCVTVKVDRLVTIGAR